jgi:beta-lactamase class A
MEPPQVRGFVLPTSDSPDWLFNLLIYTMSRRGSKKALTGTPLKAICRSGKAASMKIAGPGGPMSKRIMLGLAVVITVLVCQAALGESAFRVPASKAELEAVVRAQVASIKGTLGVYIKHVESGEWVGLNENRKFQLASVFKIPVLLTLFRQVDQGKISLDDRIVLDSRMKTYGSGLLAEMTPGLNLTVHDLALLMMARSDNTATDILFDLVTPQAISAYMSELGLKSTTIDYSTRQLILSYLGLDPMKPLTIEELAHLPPATWASPDVQERQRAFAGAEHNTSTPSEIGLLLEKSLKGEIVSRVASDKIIEIMKAHTGAEVILRYLPMATPIARKGGSLERNGENTVFNDSGIVWLPGQAGHLVICLFGNDLREVHYELKHKLGIIARAAYDYYASRPPKKGPGEG